MPFPINLKDILTSTEAPSQPARFSMPMVPQPMQQSPIVQALSGLGSQPGFLGPDGVLPPGYTVMPNSGGRLQPLSGMNENRQGSGPIPLNRGY